MEKDDKDKLSNLLDHHIKNYENQKQIKENTIEKYKLFLLDFTNKCNEVIEPKMKDIGEFLKQKNFIYKIEKEYHKDYERKELLQSIKFKLYHPSLIDTIDYSNPSFMPYYQYSESYDHISLTKYIKKFSRISSKLHFVRDYNLDEMTEQAVKDDIIKFFMELTQTAF